MKPWRQPCAAASTGSLNNPELETAPPTYPCYPRSWADVLKPTSNKSIPLRILAILAALCAALLLAERFGASPTQNAARPAGDAATANSETPTATETGLHRHESPESAATGHVATNQTDAPPREAGHSHHPDETHDHPVVPAGTLARIARENPELAAASSTSSEGLKQEPGPVSGTMIDLQGRFQTVAIATVGPDGKPTFTCLTDIGRDFTAVTNSAVTNTAR